MSNAAFVAHPGRQGQFELEVVELLSPVLWLEEKEVSSFWIARHKKIFLLFRARTSPAPVIDF
jgi:hypothetical protein